ncbi:hypothetical protein BaRGS_00006628, partial [Batillaria attramentaria]
MHRGRDYRCEVALLRSKVCLFLACVFSLMEPSIENVTNVRSMDPTSGLPSTHVTLGDPTTDARRGQSAVDSTSAEHAQKSPHSVVVSASQHEDRATADSQHQGNIATHLQLVDLQRSELTHNSSSEETDITTTYAQKVILTSDNITQCLRDKARYSLKTHKTHFFLEKKGQFRKGWMCVVEVESPPDHVMHVHLNYSCIIGVEVYDSTEQLADMTCLYDTELVARTRKVIIMLTVTVDIDWEMYVRLYLVVTALHQTSIPQLEVQYISTARGYVQTPGWDKKTEYPVLMDSWVELSVPFGHTIMVSLAEVQVDLRQSLLYLDVLNCAESERDRIKVYSGGREDKDLLWISCYKYRPPPALLYTDAVHVHFFSDDVPSSGDLGFKLLFSFHNLSAVPEKNEGSNRWNCSVPYWSDFQQHFPCNLETDCIDGEDERDCLYTTDMCGEGRITMLGRCYLFLSGLTLTWREANGECYELSGHLVSLNTPDEWDLVMDVLQYRDWDDLHVFIGAHSANPSLPKSYKYLWQWTDGAIVYYDPIPFAIGGRYFEFPACISHHPETGKEFSAINCNKKIATVSILCEFGATSGDNTVGQPVVDISQLHPEAFALKPMMARCPEGHMIHTFLACDPRSACFWSIQPGTVLATCNAPLTPLPPSFACANGVGEVPYTV